MPIRYGCSKVSLSCGVSSYMDNWNYTNSLVNTIFGSGKRLDPHSNLSNCRETPPLFQHRTSGNESFGLGWLRYPLWYLGLFCLCLALSRHISHNFYFLSISMEKYQSARAWFWVTCRDLGCRDWVAYLLILATCRLPVFSREETDTYNISSRY